MHVKDSFVTKKPKANVASSVPNAYANANSINPYQNTGYGNPIYDDIAKYYEIQDKKNSANNAENLVQTLPPPPPQQSQNANAYSSNAWQESQSAALRKAMQSAKDNALTAKQNAISSAYNAYIKATNPYGVEAESLARSGLSSSGGYSQRMDTNRFNAYQGNANSANNAYASAITDIDLAKNAGEADLAYKAYQSELAEKQNAYSMEQQKLQNNETMSSQASVFANSWAEWKGSRLANESVVRQKIRSNYPSLNEDMIDAVIGSLKN